MPQKYNITIRVSINSANGGYGGLEVSETVMVETSGFMEMCKILSQFHELGEKLKAESESKGKH